MIQSQNLRSNFAIIIIFVHFSSYKPITSIKNELFCTFFHKNAKNCPFFGKISRKVQKSSLKAAKNGTW